MIKAVIKSFYDVFMKNNRRIFYKTILLTILSYAALVAAISFALMQTRLFQIVWLDNIIDALGSFLSAVISLFLLPAVVSAFSELFSDKVIENTEKSLFKKLPRAQEIHLLDSISYTLGFSIKSAFFVVGMSIAYIFTLPFLFVPFFGLILAFATSFSFYLVNAFILGKGYFDTVAMRYCNDEQREDIWYSNRMKFLCAGFIIAFLFSVPFVNFLAPIYSFALMTRMFWLVRNKTS